MPRRVIKRKTEAVTIHLEAILDQEAAKDPDIMAFAIYAQPEDGAPWLMFTVSPKDRAIVRHDNKGKVADAQSILSEVVRFTGKSPNEVCASDVQRWRESVKLQQAADAQGAVSPG